MIQRRKMFRSRSRRQNNYGSEWLLCSFRLASHTGWNWCGKKDWLAQQARTGVGEGTCMCNISVCQDVCFGSGMTNVGGLRGYWDMSHRPVTKETDVPAWILKLRARRKKWVGERVRIIYSRQAQAKSVWYYHHGWGRIPWRYAVLTTIVSLCGTKMDFIKMIFSEVL